ncbi:unnamed protein product [Somion occarium]|uniref:FAD/NAD(P)-binding domain-containing protein n=1 Tax=Somion occarium TaxID=3059160 RepID=A0ABP1D4T4_9APHY
MSPLIKAFIHKTVAVLGASYGGARTAQLLAQQLPSDWRVVLIDRNTHFNHLYALPRFATLPGHEHKAFIPYTNVYELPPDIPSIGDRSRHLILNAQVTSIKEHSLTLSRSFPEHDIVNGVLNFDFAVYALGSHLPAPINLWGPVGDEEDVKASEKPESAPVTSEETPASLRTETSGESTPVAVAPASFPAKAVVVSSTRVNSESFVTKPQPVQLKPSSNILTEKPATELVRGTKPAAINWLKRFHKRIEKASSVLVVGGGALGIQYASDIAEVFPNKAVTLLHSRQRLLPRFDEGMHDEILSTLFSLNVTTILGERLDLNYPGKIVVNEHGIPERMVRTLSGREIRAELVLLCTGQTPNTGLIKELLPDSIVPEGSSKGSIRVTRTLQIGVPAPVASTSTTGSNLSVSSTSTSPSEKQEAHAQDPELTVPYPNLFAIGDAADAFGAINAGHNAYFQGEVAARNILKIIEAANEGKDEKEVELEKYTPGPPAIKISLGLTKALFQINGVVGKKSDVSEDLDAPAMWNYMHIATDEEGMLTL